MTQQAGHWTRDTPWRQGSVLRVETVKQFGLQCPDAPDDTCVVVITHDCDLANDNLKAEPTVEVIVGRVLAKANNGSMFGKVARRLHLRVLKAGQEAFVELIATAKASLAKSDLASHTPDASFRLEGWDLSILRSWLAARYRRSVFADAFNTRMKDTKLGESLIALGKEYGDQISMIGFVVDDGNIVERQSGDPYQLVVAFVHLPGEDAEATADRMDALVKQFQDIAAGCLRDAKQIVLKSCIAISEDDMRISQQRRFSEWDLEYLSMRDENQAMHP